MDVPLSQVARVAYITGPSAGTNDIVIDAIDNKGLASPDLTVHLSIGGGGNQAPVVQGPSSLTFSINQVVPGSQVFSSATDADGSITTLRFWDTNPGSGYITLDGVKIAASYVDVQFAQLSRVAYVTGPNAGSNAIAIEAFDNHNQSSNDLTVMINVTDPNVVGSSHLYVPIDTSVAGSTPQTATSDVDFNPVSLIWDSLDALSALSNDGEAYKSVLSALRKLPQDGLPEVLRDQAITSVKQIGFLGSVAENLGNIHSAWHAVDAGINAYKKGNLGDALWTGSTELLVDIASGGFGDIAGDLAFGGAIVGLGFIGVAGLPAIAVAAGVGIAADVVVTSLAHSQLESDLQQTGLDHPLDLSGLVSGYFGPSAHSATATLAQFSEASASIASPWTYNADTGQVTSLQTTNPTLWHQTAALLGLDTTGTATSQDLVGDPSGVPADDLLIGAAGSDRLNGKLGNDFLAGLSGDDIILGGAGNDIIDGGPGNDTAVFSGPRSQYHTIKLDDGSIVVADLRVGTPDGTDTVSNVELFQFSDRTYSLSEIINHPPVAAISDRILLTGEWAQIKDWISYSDADGDAATQYQFWDDSGAAGSPILWTPAGGIQPANSPLTVSAAKIGDVWVGNAQTSGAQTMEVRAFDGIDWSPWSSFKLTTQISNTPPMVAVPDHVLLIGEWAQIKDWVSYLDVNSNPAVLFQFWDDSGAVGSPILWTPGGAIQPANTPLTVSAANFGDVWVGNAQTAGSQTMEVRAFDGHDWSAWQTFKLTTQSSNTAPSVAVSDHSLHIGEWAQMKSWVSYSDADSNTASLYQFFDDSGAAGTPILWTPTGGIQPASTPLTVSAANLGDVWVGNAQTGGAQTMEVRAFDGHDWGAWKAFTLTSLANSPPAATIADHNLHVGEWAQIKNWTSYSDADGDAATLYQFFDDSGAAGSPILWTPAGGIQTANTPLTVSAANIGDVWVGNAQNAGSQTMEVRAFDGHDWSAWDSFKVTTLGNTPPVTTVADHSLHVGEWAQIKNWVSYSDADGDAPAQYQFWDDSGAAGSPILWTPTGAIQPANTPLTVSAANIGDVWVGNAQHTGSQTMEARAFDGHDWGAWVSFSLFTV